MIVSWPAVIRDHGSIRSQFHHCIDVMPTLMEVVGIAEPRPQFVQGHDRERMEQEDYDQEGPHRDPCPVTRMNDRSGR